MAKIYPSYEALWGLWKGTLLRLPLPLVMRMCLSDECLLTQGPTTGHQGVINAWKYITAGKRFACQMPQPEQEPGSTAYSEPDVTPDPSRC